MLHVSFTNFTSATQVIGFEILPPLIDINCFRHYWWRDGPLSYDEAQAACEAMHPDLTLAEFELPGEMAAVMGSKYLMLVLKWVIFSIAFMFKL